VNKSKRDLWVTALRSGEYVQTKGQLSRHMTSGENRYCCLGVAALVCFPNEIELTRTQELMIPTESGQLSGSLADHMEEELGLHLGQADKLIRMNDQEDKSFNEIADQLEEWEREAQFV
jgi:hypothetical protein